MTTENLLLMERRAPDALGARTVLVPYESIIAVKFVDQIDPRAFSAAGFEGKFDNS